MTAGQPPQNANNIARFIPTLGDFDLGVKVVAGVASCLYISGLLIVNIFLAKYGYTDFDLVRPRYILAGAMFVIPFSAMAATTALSCRWIYIVFKCADLLDNTPKDWRTAIAWRRMVSLVVGFNVFAICSAVIFFRILGIPTRSSSFKWLVVMWGFALAAAVAMCVLLIYERYGGLGIVHKTILQLQGPKLDEFLARYKDFVLRPFLRVVLVMTWAALYMAALYIFSRKIYPEVPFRLGGGEPRSLTLIVSDSDLAPMKGLNVHMSDLSRRTEPLSLIYEGRDFVIVLPQREPDGHPVQIQKSQIIALQVIDD